MNENQGPSMPNTGGGAFPNFSNPNQYHMGQGYYGYGQGYPPQQYYQWGNQWYPYYYQQPNYSQQNMAPAPINVRGGQDHWDRVIQLAIITGITIIASVILKTTVVALEERKPIEDTANKILESNFKGLI